MEIRPVEDVVVLGHYKSDDASIISRLVNYEPQSHLAPKLKSIPIEQLPSLRTQESLIIRDLLSVMQGTGGIYIRFNKEYNPDSEDIPQFRLVKKMDASLKSFCSRIVNLGKYYILLQRACEKWSSAKYGVVLQRLAYEIRTYLNDVYRRFVINELEMRYLLDTRFSLREFRQLVSNSSVALEMRLLYNIFQKVEEEMEKRHNIDPERVKLNNLLEELRRDDNANDSNHGENEGDFDVDKYAVFVDGDYFPEAKGGVILNVVTSTIQEHMGDPQATKFLRQLLTSISTRYCEMLHKWLTHGKLEDPHDEFMINDTMKHFSGVVNDPVEYERLWLTQYCVRKDGLCSRFVGGRNQELLFKVVMTGKLLNLVCTSLQISHIPLPVGDNVNDHPLSLVDILDGPAFELYVDQWYNRANGLALNLLYNNYHLHSVLVSLQRNFFGSQNGLLFDNMLTRHFSELSRRAKHRGASESQLQQFLEHEQQVSRHENADMQDLVLQLMSVRYDSMSFRESLTQESERYNAFEANFNQIFGDGANKNGDIGSFTSALLQGIDKEASDNTTAATNISNIHYLAFDIAVPYPLNVIVNRITVSQLQSASRYLHLLQYHSSLLDSLWLEIGKNKVWRYTGYSRSVYVGIIQRARLIHSQMNHWLKCLLQFTTEYLIADQLDPLTQRELPSTVISLQQELELRLSSIMGSTTTAAGPLMDLQLQMLDIIAIFSRYIAGMRPRLCQLSLELHERYISGSGVNRNVTPYDEDNSLRTAEELQRFLTTVQVRFNEHLGAFREGLGTGVGLLSPGTNVSASTAAAALLHLLGPAAAAV